MKSAPLGFISALAGEAILALQCPLTHMPFRCRGLRFLASLTKDSAVVWDEHRLPALSRYNPRSVFSGSLGLSNPRAMHYQPWPAC